MKLIVGNPYDYNAIALKKRIQKQNMPSPVFAKLNPNAHYIGQWLGLDVAKEWNQNYDKVWDLYMWAKLKTQSNDINKQVEFLHTKLNAIPNMNGTRITDLYMAFKLDDMNGTASKPMETEELNTTKEKATDSEEKEDPKKSEEVKSENG